jgi:hypothetical protein
VGSGGHRGSKSGGRGGRCQRQLASEVQQPGRRNGGRPTYDWPESRV